MEKFAASTSLHAAGLSQRPSATHSMARWLTSRLLVSCILPRMPSRCALIVFGLSSSRWAICLVDSPWPINSKTSSSRLVSRWMGSSSKFCPPEDGAGDGRRSSH